LHYEDTVEADVYRALRSRISIFEKVVGGLQPILARLPRLIEESVLSKSSVPDGKRNGALQALDNAISAEEESSLNLDEFADEDLEVPPRPDPAITLSDLRAVLDWPILLPLGTEAVHLDEKDYRLGDGYAAVPMKAGPTATSSQTTLWCAPTVGLLSSISAPRWNSAQRPKAQHAGIAPACAPPPGIRRAPSQTISLLCR
jgi:hypothetical protein